MTMTNAERNDHKMQASVWLFRAETTGRAEGCIEYMRQHLQLGGWTLADIRRNEEDLKLIIRNYHKREASKWLACAGGQGEAKGCIAYMREELKLGNFTLADIGTSEEGLKLVMRYYHKREAARWCSAAKGAGKTEPCVIDMRQHLQLGGWTLADIGTNEEEINILLSTKKD